MTGPMNRRRRQGGLSLIELLMFMVICGILAVGILRAFDTVLAGGAEPDRLSRAGHPRRLHGEHQPRR